MVVLFLSKIEFKFQYDKTILLPACNGHDACYHCNPVDTNANNDKESVDTNEYLSCNNMI